MSTVRDLITGSARLLGVIASGDSLPPNEMTDGLSALNDMLSSWSNNRLIVHKKVREEFSLVASQSSYTMGTGGNFDTSRPVKVEYAAYMDGNVSPAIEIPIKVLTEAEWTQVPVKELTSSIPSAIYCEHTNPLEIINIYPVPSETRTLVLYSLKPLTSYSSLGDTVNLPPGYYRALRYNLALELAPEYGKEPSASILSVALESKADIQRINIEPAYLKSDVGTRGRIGFNIYKGE